MTNTTIQTERAALKVIADAMRSGADKYPQAVSSFYNFNPDTGAIWLCPVAMAAVELSGGDPLILINQGDERRPWCVEQIKAATGLDIDIDFTGPYDQSSEALTLLDIISLNADDRSHRLTARDIADRLEAGTLTWYGTPGKRQFTAPK